MGRQKFTIDGKRLKSLREEKCKTQLTIAKELYAKLGIKTNASDKLLLTSYQRNERTGNITRQRANALAEILGVQLEVLQGERPSGEDKQDIDIPDSWEYLQQIERTIREALEEGENPILQQALQKTFDETTFTSNSAEENHEDAIRYLAEDIAQRIEAVQLVRNKNEVAALSEMTGLSAEELLRPANAEGTWFVNIHRRENQSAGFNARSEVTQRASWAIGIIKNCQELQLPDHLRGSDESIRLTQDGFWYRIEVRNSYIRRAIRIDLVRCLPDAKGLRWVKPSWRDEYLICDPLRYWARENFNFVSDFGGSTSPAGDIRRLRLLVTEYDQSIQRPTGRIVVSGNLEAMPDELFASQRKANNSHALVMNWLTVDLKHTLTPHLLDHPPACWSLRGSVISLDETKARKRPLLGCYFGPKYDIELVEKLEDGSLKPVPFREIDRKKLQECIQKMLDDRTDPAWTTDEPRRAFAPYCGEP